MKKQKHSLWFKTIAIGVVCLFLCNNVTYEASFTTRPFDITPIHNLGIALGDILGLQDWDAERIRIATRSLLKTLIPKKLSLSDIDLRKQLEKSQAVIRKLDFGPLKPCAYGTSLIGDKWYMRWWVVGEGEPRAYIAEFSRNNTEQIRVFLEQGYAKTATVETSLQEYIYNSPETELRKEILTGKRRVVPLMEVARNGLINNDYEEDGNLVDIYTSDNLSDYRCLIFKSKRLKLVCFKARRHGFMTPRLQNNFNEQYNEKNTYFISIENQEGEMVGHGMVGISPDNPHKLFFRYAIHGSPGIPGPERFTRQGYGTEVLRSLLFIAHRRLMFPNKVEEAQFLMANEDYGDYRRLKFRYLVMKEFLSKAGLADESDGKTEVIKFYIRKPKDFDAEYIISYVAKRLRNAAREEGVPDVRPLLKEGKVIRTNDYLTLKRYVQPIAQKTGMTVPRDIDWKSLGENIYRRIALSPDILSEKINSSLKHQREIIHSSQEDYSRSYEPDRKIQEEFPGTVLTSVLHTHSVFDVDPWYTNSKLAPIDIARALPYSHRRLFRYPALHHVEDVVLALSDPNLDKLLNEFVERPAHNLVRRILKFGGTIRRTNAFDQGLWGVWWEIGNASYFTPLNEDDYKPELAESQTVPLVQLQTDLEKFLDRGDSVYEYEKALLINHWEFLKGIIQGKVMPPIYAEIEPTDRCNLRCKRCFFRNVIGNGNNLDRKTLLRAVDELRAYGVKKFWFSGFGEPLLNPHTVEAMQKGISYGIKVGLYTNGVLLNEEIQEVALNADFVKISIDAINPKTFEALKDVKGSILTKSVIPNLKRFAARKKATGSKVQINASFLIQPENYQEMKEFVRAMKEIGVDSVQLKFPTGDDQLLSQVQIEEVFKEFQVIKAQHEDNNFKITIVETEEQLTQHVHVKGVAFQEYATAWIRPDGRLYPHTYSKFDAAVSFGDIRRESLKDIWEGSDRRRVLAGTKPEETEYVRYDLCIDPFFTWLQDEYRKYGVKFLDWIERDYVSPLRASTQEPVLVVGASGSVGNGLFRRIGKASIDVHGTWFANKPKSYTQERWSQLDARDRGAVFKLFEELRPKTVIHCISLLTAESEHNQELATEINVETAKNVAEACKHYGVKLVFISTNHVFAGKKKTPYTERDKPHPVNHYGRTKLAAENTIRSVMGEDGDWIIARIPYIVGHDQKYSMFLLDTLRSGKSIKVPSDTVTTPTHIDGVGEVLLRLIGQDKKGLYHITSKEPLSRYEATRRQALAEGLNPKLIETAPLEEIIAETGVRRPRNSALASIHGELTTSPRLNAPTEESMSSNIQVAERGHIGLVKKLPQGKTRVIVDKGIFERGALSKDVAGRILNGRYIAAGDICNLESCNTKDVADILRTLNRIEYSPERTIVQVSSKLNQKDIKRLQAEAPGVRFMRVNTSALNIKYNRDLDAETRWKLRFNLYALLLAARDITDEDVRQKEASATYRMLRFLLKAHGAENPDSYIEELARDNIAFLINFSLSFVSSEPWSKEAQYYLIGIRYISGAA